MGKIRRISPVKTRRFHGIFSWVKHGETMGFLGGGPEKPPRSNGEISTETALSKYSLTHRIHGAANTWCAMDPINIPHFC